MCTLGCHSESPGQTKGDPFFAHLDRRALETGAAKFPRARYVGDPNNQDIARFVNHLATHGMRLRYHDESQRWHVVSPTFGEFVVEVNIFAFPEDASLLEMQVGCLSINLAHGLNPKAKLLMSLPNLARIRSARDQSKKNETLEESTRKFNDISAMPEYRSLVNKLKQSFVEYEGRKGRR